MFTCHPSVVSLTICHCHDRGFPPCEGLLGDLTNPGLNGFGVGFGLRFVMLFLSFLF